MGSNDWHSEARQLGSIAPVQASTGLSATSDEPLKPTRGHKACIAELALRFPAARDVDHRQYQARLDFLAQDTAHIGVPLLRAACDRVAQTARGLPYASEILAAATAIVEERQRVHPKDRTGVTAAGEIIDDAERPIGQARDNIGRCMERNQYLARVGADYRVFPVGEHSMGKVQVRDNGTIAPTHGCTADGKFRNMLGEQSGLWPNA